MACRWSTASPARSGSSRAWRVLGLRTSKRGGYAPPLAKAYAGVAAVRDRRDPVDQRGRAGRAGERPVRRGRTDAQRDNLSFDNSTPIALKVEMISDALVRMKNLLALVAQALSMAEVGSPPVLTCTE